MTELGRTDDLGRLQIQIHADNSSARRGARVFAAADGFLPSDERPLRPGGETVLRLGESSMLGGRVVRTDGSAPASPVQVLAAPSEHGGLRLDSLWRALEGDPRVLMTSTDSEGRFRFTNADPALRYDITCGGAGWVAHEPSRGVRPGEPGIVIELVRAFAVRIVQREADGGPLHFPSTAPGPFPGGFFLESEDPTADLYSDRVAAVLAGLPPEFATPTSEAKLLLATCDTDALTFGPLRFQAQYAGYAPVDVRVFTRSVDQPVPLETIRFTRTVEGFGSIVVHLRTEGTELPPWLEGCAGSLTLRRAGAPRLRISVPRTSGTRVRIDGIPRGRYRARFRSANGPLTLPSPEKAPWTLEVGEAPASLELDLTGLGGIEFSLQHRDGTLYRGAASCILDPAGVMLEAPASPVLTYGGQALVRWSAPPYRIPALPPRPYRVSFIEPEVTGDQGTPDIEIEVRPDELARVRLELGG